MISVIGWLIPAIIGTHFTIIAGLKFYGIGRGIVGGADKPVMTRLCGT